MEWTLPKPPIRHSRDPQGGVESDDHEPDEIKSHEDRGIESPREYHSHDHR